MGKYMRNDKITGDVAVMEVSQASLGVRTRAKTIALQRLQSTAKTPTPLPLDSESCYLQLRSRRLEKSPLLTDTRKQPQEQQKSTPKGSCREKPEKNLHANFDSRASSRLRMSSWNAGSVGSVSISCCQKDLGGTTDRARIDYEPDSYDFDVEVSCGENNLEFETKERSTGENTPCSLIRDSNTIATPGSTTRPTSSTMDNQRIWSARQRLIPTSYEIEEFFTRAERQLQKKFIERYNFDVLNDLPLTGRYDWVRVNP